VFYQNGAYVEAATNITAGNLAVAGSQGYVNGAADGAAIGAWGGAASEVLYIGCRHRHDLGAGSRDQYLTAYIKAFALYDTALTGAQVLAVATAMAAL